MLIILQKISFLSRTLFLFLSSFFVILTGNGFGAAAVLAYIPFIIVCSNLKLNLIYKFVALLQLP